MAKGDGSITQRARGVYLVEVCFGKDPITGERQRVTKTVRGTKADARKVRDQLRKDYENGLRLDADKVTFAEFCPVFTEARLAAGKAKEKTIRTDERRLMFVCGIVGNLQLKQFNAQTIESLLIEIQKRRLAEGRRCGNSTLHHYYVLIKQLFKKAVDYDIILRNPCDKVQAPPIDESERRSLDREEATRLLSLVREAEEKALDNLTRVEAERALRGDNRDRSRLRFVPSFCSPLTARIGIASGMRLGEILRLTWNDIDLRTGKLTVRVSKTKAGCRTLAVDGATRARLAQWKSLQSELFSEIGLEQTSETPVICSQTGAHLDECNFEKWWRSFRNESGFDGLRFHELRHTQATQLLANGVDVKTVQARLGHADASLTLKWYAHALPENDEKAAQMIGVLFSDRPKEARIINLQTA